MMHQVFIFLDMSIAHLQNMKWFGTKVYWWQLSYWDASLTPKFMRRRVSIRDYKLLWIYWCLCTPWHFLHRAWLGGASKNWWSKNIYNSTGIFGAKLCNNFKYYQHLQHQQDLKHQQNRQHYGYITATFWLHSGCTLATFWLHSDYNLTTFWLQSDYLQ